MQEKNTKIIKNRQLFAGRFRKLRKDLYLSQRDFAKKIGLTGNTQISKFEKGTSEPSIESLRRIAKLTTIDTRVDIHELVTGTLSPIAESWKEENRKLLELLAKYISWETARLLDERHKLWGDLDDAKAKKSQGITGQDEYIDFLKSELHRLQERISDVTEDQHYVQEALDGMK